MVGRKQENFNGLVSNMQDTTVDPTDGLMNMCCAWQILEPCSRDANRFDGQVDSDCMRKL